MMNFQDGYRINHTKMLKLKFVMAIQGEQAHSVAATILCRLCKSTRPPSSFSRLPQPRSAPPSKLTEVTSKERIHNTQESLNVKVPTHVLLQQLKPRSSFSRPCSVSALLDSKQMKEAIINYNKLKMIIQTQPFYTITDILDPPI